MKKHVLVSHGLSQQKCRRYFKGARGVVKAENTKCFVTEVSFRYDLSSFEQLYFSLLNRLFTFFDLKSKRYK